MNTKRLALFALLVAAVMVNAQDSLTALPISINLGSSDDDGWGCAEWRQGVCTRCSYRFVQKGLSCEPVNPLCKTWDSTGKCLSCYAGYSICAEGCAPDKTLYSDLNCANYDASAKCTKCAAGSYLKNGKCTQYNPNCKTADQNSGDCLSCYVGYSVQAGQCVLVPLVPDNTAPSDLLCARWQGTVCQQCSASAYFSNGVCTQVNPLCKTFDSTNGACTSCYAGYNLNNGDCAAAPQTQDNSAPADKLCAQWVGTVCQKCSVGSVFRQGVCVQVDPQCKTYDNTTGACLSCYAGYYLSQGQCLVTPAAPAAEPTDKLCAQWNGTVCVKCAQSAYFSNGVCVASNPLCKTFDNNNGACLSCYYGYLLQSGNCVVADTSSPSDLLCARWQNGVCVQCAQSAYLSNGVCTQSNPLCKTFDSANGACLSCYAGYNLNNGNCVVAPQTQDNSAPTDVLCAKWDGKVCTQCSTGSYFKNGVCTQADALCKTFDNTNGNCLSCYAGYTLTGGSCVAVPLVADNSQPADVLCARWSGSTCLQCSKSSYSVNGVCTQSDPLCKTFDSTNGACTSCYNGYLLQGGACEQDKSGPADPLCAQWSGIVCQKCATFAYFNNGVCTQVSPQCRTFDSNNGACQSCYNGYLLQAGQCVLDTSAPTDLLCAKWQGAVCQQCSATAYFQNGVCTQSNPQCKTFNSNSGACTSCYNGYVLQAGNCNAQTLKQPSGPSATFDIYCKKYTAGACSACFYGFALQNGKCVAAFDKTDCPP